MTIEIKTYKFADGFATAYDLDNGDAVIDFIANGERVAQIAVSYDNGSDKQWEQIDSDLSNCENATISDTLRDPVEWENGMGGSAFDSEYWTDFD